MPHKLSVIIDSDCIELPQEPTGLASQGMALLNFLHCMGYDPLDPPAAELLAKSQSLEGNWVIVSPIQWQATHNDALIVAIGKDLQLSDKDAQHLFTLYADYLAEEQITLHYLAADLWLLNRKEITRPHAKPPYQLLNKSLMPELAMLGNSMHWQKIITESQMFFASQTFKTAVNGVWLWGAANLGEKRSIAVCADSHFFSMATLCSAEVTLYNPALSLKDFHILLLQDIDVLSTQHKEELKKINATWHWNNTVLTHKAYPWFIRLWRSMFHAH